MIDLRHCDCMEYLATCEDNAFELAIVDPPYGIEIHNSGRLGHYGGKGKLWDNETPSQDYFKEVFRISRNAIIWGGNYFALPPTRGFIIWDKQQPAEVSFASCEYAWTSFDRSAKTFYMRPQNADGIRIHPTQKPVKLYEWLLMNYAKEGDRILDTHLGSGSIALACHNLGFDLVGCELDSDYYAAACGRLDRHKKQLRMF